MSSKLMNALHILNDMERSQRKELPLKNIDPRAKLLVTLFFLVTMLSLPIVRLSELILFFIYPILTAAMYGIDYVKVCRRSLIVIPLVALIALPNIFLQHEPIFMVGRIAITLGWTSFISIIIRGILSLQALLTLIAATGFYRICRAMRGLGMPAILVTQLFFVVRYIHLLLEEALAMQRARAARGFGRKSYPLKMWSLFTAQLLLRSIRRAERIGEAMASRQFHGELPALAIHATERWRARDSFYTIAWCCTLLLLRILHFAERFF